MQTDYYIPDSDWTPALARPPKPPWDIGDLTTGLYSAIDYNLESRAAFLVKQRAEMRARGDFSELPHKAIY